MPTTVSRAARGTITISDALAVGRRLRAAYARERLEEVLNAVAEDALNPHQADLVSWHDDARFEMELREAVREVTDATIVVLTERLEELIAAAPPRVLGRMSAQPHYSDRT
jgi:hypothetical protein